MPELPEVETIRVGLAKLLMHRQVREVQTLDSPKSFPNDPNSVKQFLVGAVVVAVRRRAKVLLIDLSTGYTLVTHLRMTGQLIFVGDERWGGGHPNDSFLSSMPDRFTRVVLSFVDGSHLYFNDLRKFGYMKLVPTELVSELPFMKKVGPEPLEDSFNGNILFERLQRRKNTTIKVAILDQSVLAGVGNIYADESLWAAKIHPATPVRLLSKSKIQNLTSEIISVLRLSIEKGGSTDKNYVDAEGKKGSYLKFAKVFRLEGQPCPRCGTAIEKIRVAGRGTHICPVCQKLDKTP